MIKARWLERSPRKLLLPGRHKERASAFRRWLVTRAYSPHPEPPVLRVGAILRERQAISRVMSWMIIYLAVPSPAQSSNLPGQCCLERQPTGRRSVLFGLASDGVYMCPGCYHPGGGLLHRLCTLTGLGRRFFSVALSWEFPPPDVIRHPAL